VDDLIGTPILHHILICGPDRELSLFLRYIWSSLLLWLNSVTWISQLVLGNLFHSMRVDDLVFFLNIERFELSSITHCFDCIIAPVLSLIASVNAGRVSVPHKFIYHLPPPRPAHAMLVVLD